MSSRPVAPDPPYLRLARLAVAGLLLVAPFVFVPTADEAFRVPKLLVSESLGLLSLVALSFGLRGVERPAAAIRSSTALRAVLPLLALALISLATTDYPAVVRPACASFAIGAACLVGWSAALDERGRRRLLDLLLLPAGLLAVLALLQLSGLYRPLALAGGGEVSREGVTSLAGNAGDLAAYLVLPCLLLQARLTETRGTRRRLLAAVLALCIFGLAATQTFTALAALGAASFLFWAFRLPRRRLAAAAAVVVIVGGGLLASIPQLRARTASKISSLADRDWDLLLTYRLDGWRAATWMLAHHPLTGVGHGAFRSQYAAARIDRVDHGARYEGRYRQLSFLNAHNDALEVGGELGLPGLLALGWGIWVVVAAARRFQGGDRALGFAALLAVGLLAAGGFPFETALIAYPWLLFLSGVLASPAPAPAAAPAQAAPARRKRART